jgi:hypothetical protein
LRRSTEPFNLIKGFDGQKAEKVTAETRAGASGVGYTTNKGENAMTLSGRLTVTGLAFAATLAFAAIPQASAAGDDAGQILKTMSDYLAAQKTISASYDTSIEVITPEMEKIQFDSSGTIVLDRPNQIHATRTGGYADVELFFDGKTFTLYGKNINGYTQIDAPGSVEEMIDALHSHAVAVPGADLLLPNVYDSMMERVITAKHIGLGVIGGVECDHLAFRAQDVDWQLWVQTGANPIPRKYVITSKAIGGGLQYTLVIRDWKTDAPADPATFAFKAPSGAQKLNEDALKALDEIPPGAPAKGQ